MNTLKVTFEQDGFHYSSETNTHEAISFRDGMKFVVNAFAKHLAIAKIVQNPSKRAKISKPFNVRIETSDGETYENTVKFQLPKTADQLGHQADKLLKVMGISMLNEFDRDFAANYQLLVEGKELPYALVGDMDGE